MSDDDSRDPKSDLSSSAFLPIDDASFLRSVLEALPCYVVQLDPERRIRYVNRLRSGYTRDDLVGRSIREFSAPEDLENFERAADKAMQTGQMQTYIARGVAGEQTYAHYQGYAVPIEEADGSYALIVVATDVTEHVARSEALEDSREKLRLAVEATGIGLWTWDVKNDRLEWDPRMIDIVGHEPAPPQQYAQKIVHPDDRERVTAALVEAGAGRPRFVLHRVVRSNGEVRWIQPCGRVIRNQQGEVVRLIGGVLDVTRQRMVDEHLRNAQKLDAIGSLTAGIAHNFNNLLAGMIPAIELSLAKVPADLAPVLREALYAGQRATDMIRQLMTYAGQRGPGELGAHDLGSMVRRVVSMCERTFQNRVRIELKIQTGCAPAACDPNGIEQVMMNLLINARDAVIEANTSDPAIVVEVMQTLAQDPDLPESESLPFVSVCVRDNGVGMTPEVRQRLFEPFHTTKAPGKGTGLGLATSQRTIRDQGGFITFDSEPHVGTTASIFLPISRAEPLRTMGTSMLEPSARRGRVLIVDDERAVRHVIGRLLTERGHDVRLAADGPEAAIVLEGGWKPHVILLDCFMPGWDPTRTLDELYTRAGQAAIIYHSGQHAPNDEQGRVRATLDKPATAELLFSTVEQWIPSS